MSNQRKRSAIRVLGVGALGAGLLITGTSFPSSAGTDVSQTFISAVPAVPESLDAVFTPQGDSQRWTLYEFAANLALPDSSQFAGNGCEALPTPFDLAPELAESWEYSDDRTTITVNLRRGVLSAAGNEMTADDVVWTLQRALQNGSAARSIAFSTGGLDEANPVEKIDDYTIRINVEAPSPFDLAQFNYITYNIIDLDAIEEYITEDDPWAQAYLAENLPNFGPWQIENFSPADELVLVRNPNYWNADETGNVGRLIIKSIPEASTRFQLLQQGDIDYAERLSFDQYQSIAATGAADVLKCLSPNRDTLILNFADERFADQRVREAISLAIDRDEIVAGAYLGYGAIPAEYGLGSFVALPEGARSYEHDLERAKQLLADAGYPDGFSFQLEVSPARPGPWVQQSAVLVQSQLSEIGIQVSLNTTAGASEFRELFYEKRYAGIMYQEPPVFADPFYSAANFNLSTSNNNTQGYANPAYDELVAQLRSATPGEERDDLLREISDTVLADIPVIYLVDTSYLYAFAPGLEGFAASPNGALYVKNITKG